MSIRCGKCKGRHANVDEVRACYAAQPVAKPEPATEGMYCQHGEVFKVQRALYGSGRLYAKILSGDTFVMAPGAISKLTQADRMTEAQAAEFGKLYGRCVRCQAPLTDEASIARGIGPVCATKI